MVYRRGIRNGLLGYIREVYDMTTARERYEQKTKVVTFRVSLKDYNYLEEIKTKGGLSNSDLIKLGAGIAQEEINAKLAELSGLEDRLAELKASVREEQHRLSESLDEERRHQLEELATEMKAFKLFEQEWSPEEVAERLGLPKATAFDYLENWAKGKKDKQITERILLVKCLQKHIRHVQEQIRWYHLFPWQYNENLLNELEEQMEGLQQLLVDPSKISKGDKQWLLTEYSSQV